MAKKAAFLLGDLLSFLDVGAKNNVEANGGIFDVRTTARHPIKEFEHHVP